MLLAVIRHGGLSDESVEDMANANLHVMRSLCCAAISDKGIAIGRFATLS